ncbi:MAG: hypothetical protein ABF714_03735 [Novacetimonas hansenii]|uniref:hypothetical protein n=1 Tax=Novacetimonas hansenii TaxID=436 RepID=UPI0039E7D82C
MDDNKKDDEDKIKLSSGDYLTPLGVKLGKFFEEKINTNDYHCPFCGGEKWYLLDTNEEKTGILNSKMFLNLCYTVSCASCGFVRMHLRSVVDRQIKDEE